MSVSLRPWQLLLAILAGWINRQQLQVIDYLRTENQVLREKLGKKRILLNDDQRRRLAVKGKALGRRALQELATIVTPETILRWHRRLVAQKWDYSQKRRGVGRPRVRQEIVDLLLRMARENPTWGYDRIQGALANVGYRISDTTVGNILKAHGIEPAPDRKQRTRWRSFLKAHWDSLAAVDFTTLELWTRRGLVTFYVLIVIELKTRRVEVAGVTPHPDGAWMKQVGRNLTDCFDGFLRSSRWLIMDRDTKYQPLRELLASTEIRPVLLPPRSPDLNAYAERFVRSLKEECLDRLILFGEAALRRTLRSYLDHYHRERNHQSLDNQLIEPEGQLGNTIGKLACRKRLGGMLRYYHRAAA